MTPFTLQAANTSKTAAFTGANVDFTGVTIAPEIILDVTSLTAGMAASVQILASRDATPFATETLEVDFFQIVGPYSKDNPYTITHTHPVLPILNHLIAGAPAKLTLRAAVSYLEGGTIVYGVRGNR